jgi:phosphatidylserine synthase
MVTLMSIACGFGSIVISVDNARIGAAQDYRLAAILLVLAGVFDALDGWWRAPPTPPPNSACSSIRSPM